MKKRFLAIFIVVLMLFSQISVLASSISSADNTDKITDDLKESMLAVNKNEYISVYVWLKGYDDSAVYATLSKSLGVTVTAENEESYIQFAVQQKVNLMNSKQNISNQESLSTNKSINNLSLSAKADALLSSAEISQVMSKKEIETCLESGMSNEEIISLSERTQFVSLWRDARKTLNEYVNNSFYNKLDKNKCQNININSLLTYVELECTKEYIYELSNMSEVERIGKKYSQGEYITNTTSTLDNYDPDYVNHHMKQNSNISYDAAGIKIGVLEVPDYGYNTDGTFTQQKDGVKYDNTNPHLQNKLITTNYSYSGISVANRKISQHATTVLSIICGNQVSDGTDSSIKYSGLAPNATVFYACYQDAENTNNFASAMQWLIDNDVQVINMSFSFIHGYNSFGVYPYTEIDQQIDMYSRDYRVVIVTSAGNGDSSNYDNYVYSVGLAYNAITVGNATKSSTTNEDTFLGINTENYCLHEKSCYNQNVFYTNKPDICAIGTNILMLDSSNSLDNRGSGTSFSAPMVTGTVALMMKANSSLINKPDKVKAILLASADEDAIVDENNSFINDSPTTNYKADAFGAKKNKTGAGLLNIPAAITHANSAYTWSHSFSGYSSTTSIGSQKVYIPFGSVFKVGCVFEKASDEVLESNYNIDINIRIKDMTNTVIFDSKSTSTSTITADKSAVDNVEMFNILFNNSGEYIFELYFNTNNTSYTSLSKPINATMVVACTCENPDISGYSVSDVANRRTCYNCYFFDIIESYNEVNYNEGFPLGTIHYNLQYTNTYLDNLKIIDKTHLNISYTPSISGYTARLSFSDSNTTYTSTGYIEQRSYIAVVYDNNGDSVAAYTVNVSIEWDSISEEFYLRN